MDELMRVPWTMAFGKANVAAGTTSTMSTTGTLPYAIRGKAYSKAAITNGATPILDAYTGLAFRPISANQTTVVVLGLNAAGTLKACQGSIESGGNPPQFPGLPDDFCPIAYMLCKGGATLVGTWTFGSNNNSSVTGMTWVIQDLSGLPDRPQSS